MRQESLHAIDLIVTMKTAKTNDHGYWYPPSSVALFTAVLGSAAAIAEVLLLANVLTFDFSEPSGLVHPRPSPTNKRPKGTSLRTSNPESEGLEPSQSMRKPRMAQERRSQAAKRKEEDCCQPGCVKGPV